MANPGAMVSLQGPTTLTPGARGTYTLTITSTLAGFMAGGLDVSLAGSSGARLATVSSGTQVREGDITHREPIARTGASVQVQFAMVAPTATGTVMIQAVGNAVNGDNAITGDSWSRTALAVVVTDDGGVSSDASVAPDVPPAEGELYDPSASMAYGGCAVSSRGDGTSGWTVALGMVMVMCGTRRRGRTCAGA